MVGARGDELVDQIAFGAHDLDAVITCPLREARAADIRGDRPFDTPACKRPRPERRDRRADRRWRDRQRVIGVAAGVQDLERDPAARGMDGCGDQPMLRDLPGERQLSRPGLEPADEIRRDASRDDQANAAARALGIERGHPLVAIGGFLEPRVHRAHQHAVRKSREPEVERCEQVRIERGHAIERGLSAEKVSSSR